MVAPVSVRDYETGSGGGAFDVYPLLPRTSSRSTFNLLVWQAPRLRWSGLVVAISWSTCTSMLGPF